MILYLSIELVSIPSYILAGILKNDRKSNEASLKYVIFGSFSSGLMVSQHGIGDYSKSADQCFNQTLNNKIVTLPERLKKEGFKTLFAATGGRFSSKCGFAKGYDSHYHSFTCYDPSIQPDLNWVYRQLSNNHFCDKFIFLHTDYFHGPKMIWNNATKGNIYDYNEIIDDDKLIYIYERGLKDF